jgi:hypothetical protein
MPPMHTWYLSQMRISAAASLTVSMTGSDRVPFSFLGTAVCGPPQTGRRCFGTLTTFSPATERRSTDPCH